MDNVANMGWRKYIRLFCILQYLNFKVTLFVCYYDGWRITCKDFFTFSAHKHTHS